MLHLVWNELCGCTLDTPGGRGSGMDRVTKQGFMQTLNTMNLFNCKMWVKEQHVG